MTTQKVLPEGKYLDCLVCADGRVVDYGWRSNVIVDQCRELLAAFMHGQTVSGIQRISLGRGDTSWDTLPYEAPVSSTSSLVDPSPRDIAMTDAEMSISFLDIASNTTTDVHSRIEVSVTIEGDSLPIGPGEEFPLREFALYGELNTSDYMIDYVRHGVIHIGQGDVLTRRVRLVF